jgi:hypothetical protein
VVVVEKRIGVFVWGRGDVYRTGGMILTWVCVMMCYCSKRVHGRVSKEEVPEPRVALLGLGGRI